MCETDETLPLLTSTDKSPTARTISNTPANNYSTNKMPTFEEIKQLTKQYKQQRNQSLQDLATTAKHIHCPQCGIGTAVTVWPQDGIVACEHIVKELRKHFGAKQSTNDPLFDIATFEFWSAKEWLNSIPEGFSCFVDDNGCLDIKKIGDEK